MGENMTALTIGQQAPDFSLTNHIGELTTLNEYLGKNVVLAFFPLAWTPVWTNQIPSYQILLDRFEGLQTQVLGLSVDSIPCLQAWAKNLGGITYPLLSDFYPQGSVAEMYGILGPKGAAKRAIVVIDKQGFIRYLDVHTTAGAPDNDVLLRVLMGVNNATANGQLG